MPWRSPTRYLTVSGLVLLFAMCGVTAQGPSLLLATSPDRVELAVGAQKVTFSRDGDAGTEAFVLTTQVRTGENWEPLFDAGLPLLSGTSFNLAPTEYVVQSNTDTHKAVVLRGKHPSLGYRYEIRAEASDESPLLKLTITCRLPSGLTLSGPEPVAALWMRNRAPELTVDQGPDSIYGSLAIPHNFGFPAAYLWDGGKEAAVFFDLRPMTWFSPGGVHRFHDIRIMTYSADEHSGLGMHLKKVSGNRLPEGDMVTVLYLHSAPRAAKPEKLEAIGRMIEIFAPLHPATSTLPRNSIGDGEVSWEYFAKRAILDLMLPQRTYAEIDSLWSDPPMGLVGPYQKMLVHPGRQQEPGQQLGWDFSTVNNHLSPWILYSRLHPDERIRSFALAKRDGLPRFYDPLSGIIRYGTREPARLGDVDMSWQNFFFHFETLRAYDALAPEDFNPAVAGRLLMAADGLIDLAHNVNYVFPQWWNAKTKQPESQQDAPALGKVREPWQAGTYAYVMMRAFEMTDDPKYLEEAQRSIETLLTKMEFTVSNDVYTRTYTDPADFPIAELFGNSYGIIAARKVAEATGDKKFPGYSRDFLHTLLRLTFWYEDETDAVSRDLRNAGLFYPHGGAHVTTPWENLEAYVGIVDVLANNSAPAIRELLLKLANLNRINSYYYYPAVYTPTVQALDPGRPKDLGQYFPIEPFYSLEGTSGHAGLGAAYMASLGMWNYWLYEALAQCDDREVMLLNTTVLETFEEALAAERTFIAFNPTEKERSFQVSLKHLPEGQYDVLLRGPGGEEMWEHASTAELEEGYPVTLAPMEHCQIKFTATDAPAKKEAIQIARHARDTLSHAYARLQQSAESVEPGALAGLAEDFKKAVQQYQNMEYAVATRRAQEILQAVSAIPSR